MVNGRGIPYVLVPPRKRNFVYPTSPPSTGATDSRSRVRDSSSFPRKRQKTRADQEESIQSAADLAELDDCVDEKDLSLNEDRSDFNDEIPVRKLTSFDIFRYGYLVEATELLGGFFRGFTASGLVRISHVSSGEADEEEETDEEDNSDDDDLAQRVKNLEIIGFDVHNIADGKLDRNVYIKTARAWYILEDPSLVYRPFFQLFHIRYIYTHHIISSSIRNPKTTYDEFVKSLCDPLTESQLLSVEIKEYLDSQLAAISLDLKPIVDLSKVPLVKSLQKNRKFSEHLKMPDAVVTPIIGRVVGPHLQVAMHVLGSNSTESDEPLLKESYEELHEHDDPASIRWGGRTGPDGDKVLLIDDVVYRSGDIVAVNPGEDAHEDRAQSAVLAQYCRNSYARKVWFIQIQYFFDDPQERDFRGEPVKKLHGVWLIHASETIMGEFAHSQELCLLEECDDITVSSIFRKCDVHKLEPGEMEPPDESGPQATSFFYRSIWDEIHCDFKSAYSTEEQTHVRSRFHERCINCAFVEEELFGSQLQSVHGPEPESEPIGFSHNKYNCHVADFVFVKPAAMEACPLFIAQIECIEGLRSGLMEETEVFCSVRYFKRNPEEKGFKDNRRLYRSTQVNKITARDIDGVCLVKFIDQDDLEAMNEWIQEDSELERFYTNQRKTDGRLVTMSEEELEVCDICAQDHQREALEKGLYHAQNDPLSMLDVFAGAGGLSEGMRRTGFCETKCAIEQSISASWTFSQNHSETQTICADANDVLRYIVDRETGRTLASLTACDGSVIPDSTIPRRGELDVIIGGPPCQPFSGLNVYKKEDDIRTTLPYTMLGFVEVLQPTWFLLENVTGLLYHGFKMGSMKLICRVIAALGYQFRFQVLQAGQYGVPQDRERIIFLAAKHGHTLPEFPIPTHAFPKSARRWKMPMRRRACIVPQPRSKSEKHLYAAHAPVTIDDAISDLPPFEWSSPHKHMKRTSEDTNEQRRRSRSGILQCNVFKEPVGFPNPVEYATKPRTRYQRAMRSQHTVEQHVTQAFSPSVVELTTLVPLKPWSNHRFLEKDFLPEAMKTSSNKVVFYGRLDGAHYFKTAVTMPKPNGRSPFIHPTLKRAFTLREFARSQGFPDDYQFRSIEITPAARLKDYFKQVGNAVPLQLAAALARSIGAASIHDWRVRRQREMSEEI
ncbi:S-adenosyl-L-methionine-dependent methyltransferase [Mycena crocata]|nr:S-adenosyl-L-methionine-dependent methyltransferase [Mycena crocata]